MWPKICHEIDNRKYDKGVGNRMFNRLVQYVVDNMANDATSTAYFRKIVSYAEQGKDLTAMRNVITEIEKEVDRSNDPFVLKFLKKTTILFIGIILPFYYLLTLIAFIPFFFIGLFKGKDFEQEIDYESWEVLFQHWGKYPNSFLTKAFELFYFQKEDISQPSLEVGVYSGDTSKGVFHKKQISVGMEFVPLHLLRYAVGNVSIHGRLIGGDIYHIPFADNTFTSAFTVHSIDDIQRGASGAISELNRVLKPGGKLVFSSYSGHFGDQNIILKLLSLLNLKQLYKKLFGLIYIGTNNIYSETEWQDILEANHLIMERYTQFIPMGVASLIDIPFRLEGYLMNLFNFHNAFKGFVDNKKISKGYKYFLMKTLCGIWGISFDRNGKEKAGMNIFIVARKIRKELAREEEKEFSFDRFLLCPACGERIGDSTNKNFPDGEFILCKNCEIRYPVVGNIPIIINEQFNS
jgi:SAM-dependent methyltransferase